MMTEHPCHSGRPQPQLTRPGRGPARLLTLTLAAVLALPLAAIAQPGETYRPGKKSEPRQKTPRESGGKDGGKPGLREEGRRLFGGGGGENETSEAAATWSIVLFAFRGETRQTDAQRALATVQSEWGLPDAYLDERGASTVVVFGRYDDPQGERAQADLERVRAVEAVVGGEHQRPFEFAFLAPPSNFPGNQPEFDLRNAQKLHGKWALYTLQVGVYRREDGKPTTTEQMAEFRKFAEDAVLTLRREGEQAFYYHGPTGSTVTIGLFGEDDFDPQFRLESPRLRTLRTRYPHNLLNGAGIKRRMTVTDQQGRQVKTERLDPSMLVAVPKVDR